MKLVADANVLLAAILGGKANVVLRHPAVEQVVTTQGSLDEVEEYIPILARKRRLALDVLLLGLASLPVDVVGREVYAATIPQAKKWMQARDPDDVEILALTLHTKLPLWSNDNDFEGIAIEWYTTAELIQTLGPSKE